MCSSDLMSRQPSAAMQGIAFMLAGSFFMSLNNAILKWLSAGYPAGQILFLRSAFIFVAIGFFIWRAGGFHSARIGNPKVHLLRASCVVCSAFLFMNAVRLLPLADVIDIDQEKARLQTAIAKSDGEIGKLEKKLGNQQFLAKAPEAVVEEQRERLAASQTTRAKLVDALERLSAAM